MKTYKSEDFIKDNLSLGIFSIEHAYPEPTHNHDFAEIVYALSGESTEYINEKKYHMHRGDMLFINYGSKHSRMAAEDYAFVNICFDPEIIGRRIISQENAFYLLSLTAFDDIRSEKFEGIIHFHGDERRIIEAILSDMIHEHSCKLPERSAVLESYMTVLISKILRKLQPTEQNKNEVDGIWRELCSYIDKNLDKKLTLSDLAKRCFYNPSYFSRAFKEKFNIPLAEYIGRERAASAAVMLDNTNLSAEDIAVKCGYGDKSGLYRAFSRFYGCTPTEYRQKCNK